MNSEGNAIIDNFLNTASRKYDAKIMEDAWKEEMDENWEWWHKMSYVDKPDFIKRKEELEEQWRRGWIFNKIPKPLDDEVVIRMDKPHKGINLLVDDNNFGETYFGEVASISSNETEFNIGDKIVFDYNRIAKRMYINNTKYLISKKPAILAYIG